MENLLALVPSLAVLAVFVFVVRAMVNGDRKERAQRLREDALARQEAARVPSDTPNGQPR